VVQKSLALSVAGFEPLACPAFTFAFQTLTGALTGTVSGCSYQSLLQIQLTNPW
jgi:hypothetical protein